MPNDININTQLHILKRYNIYMLLPLNQTYSSSPLISIHEGSCENKSVEGLSIGGETIEWEDRRERRVGLICKWNGKTRLNFTSNGAGNFLAGGRGRLATWFHVEPSHVTIFNATGC